MSELATVWADQEHEVHLVLLAKSDDFYMVPSSVVIHRLGFENKGRFQKVRAQGATFFKLRRLVIDLNPRCVLSFLDYYNVFTLMTLIGTKVPVFISDRANPLKSFPLSLAFLRKMTYCRASGIIAQTELAKTVLIKTIRCVNICVIPNPVKRVEVSNYDDREKIILSVGRLVKEKGQHYLIEAFSRIENSDWRLVILGDGPLMKDLQQQIMDLGISDKVSLEGRTKDVNSWLARASIFAFPSLTEGFPNALAEAMVAGLPVVSFDCDAGPKDLILHGLNGFLVSKGDGEGLRMSLTKLMEDQSLRTRLGSEAEKIARSLDRSSIARRWLDFMTNSALSAKK